MSLAPVVKSVIVGYRFRLPHLSAEGPVRKTQRQAAKDERAYRRRIGAVELRPGIFMEWRPDPLRHRGIGYWFCVDNQLVAEVAYYPHASHPKKWVANVETRYGTRITLYRNEQGFTRAQARKKAFEYRRELEGLARKLYR